METKIVNNDISNPLNLKIQNLKLWMWRIKLLIVENSK